MNKKEKYEAIIIIIVIILIPIFSFEEGKIKEEKEEMLENTAKLLFNLYDNEKMTVEDIKTFLDSFSKEDRNYIRRLLIEKGVLLQNDNEKK